jgi:hypothetical protein
MYLIKYINIEIKMEIQIKSNFAVRVVSLYYDE